MSNTSEIVLLSALLVTVCIGLLALLASEDGAGRLAGFCLLLVGAIGFIWLSTTDGEKRHMVEGTGGGTTAVKQRSTTGSRADTGDVRTDRS